MINLEKENSVSVLGENVANPQVGKKKVYKYPRVKKPITPESFNNPEHVTALVLLLKNNAEIRRFTSIGILNYLTQIGEISGVKKYVTFKWNKFSVCCDGLAREYKYSESWFIRALVASYTSFAAASEQVINQFCELELDKPIEKVVYEDSSEPTDNGESED